MNIYQIINKLGYSSLKEADNNFKNNPELFKLWEIIRMLCDYNDELFDLTNNIADGLAQESLYELLDKYEKYEIK